MTSKGLDNSLEIDYYIMMKITEIIESWKSDAKIDDLNIDIESSRIPSLHAKYVEWLSTERSIMRSVEIQRRNLIRKLRDFYLGVLSQEELAELNRDPFPQRILKNEVMTYVESDATLIALDTKLTLQQEKVDVLQDILKSIHSRNFTLKTTIDWRRLMLGG